jgi:hypothetical protein
MFEEPGELGVFEGASSVVPVANVRPDVAQTPVPDAVAEPGLCEEERRGVSHSTVDSYRIWVIVFKGK